MECPVCGREMYKLTRSMNGKVSAWCPVCQIEIDTKDLEPPFYDNQEEYEDES